MFKNFVEEDNAKSKVNRNFNNLKLKVDRI